jgi:hypothetical protein
MCNIQMLNLLQVSNELRQDTGERVGTRIEDRHIAKQPDFCWQATAKAVVQENDLIQSVSHLTNALWNATGEFVVGENNN